MHIAAPPYHVQSTARRLRDGFPYFAYHESVSVLWAQRWRPFCATGNYPFMDADVADFDPIFTELIAISGDDPSVLSRPDDYAKPFLPAALRLVAEAEDAEATGDNDAGRDLYLRAAAVYRIARFPINRSTLTQEAWEAGKAAYEKGASLLDPPSVPVDIAFSHADASSGDLDLPIQAYLRKPKGRAPEGGWPVLLFVCGLDAYRTDQTPRIQQHIEDGFAALSFEIPGTGDCPAALGDPTSPDRLMSSVIDWVIAGAEQHQRNPTRIAVRGISTVGYYAFRVAHTHADELFAVGAHGGETAGLPVPRVQDAALAVGRPPPAVQGVDRVQVPGPGEEAEQRTAPDQRVDQHQQAGEERAHQVAALLPLRVQVRPPQGPAGGEDGQRPDQRPRCVVGRYQRDQQHRCAECRVRHYRHHPVEAA